MVNMGEKTSEIIWLTKQMAKFCGPLGCFLQLARNMALVMVMRRTIPEVTADIIAQTCALDVRVLEALDARGTTVGGWNPHWRLKTIESNQISTLKEYESIEIVLPGKTRHVEKGRSIPSIWWLSERFRCVHCIALPCETCWKLLKAWKFSRTRGSDSCYLDVKDRSSCTQTWSKAMGHGHHGLSLPRQLKTRSVVATGLAACRSAYSCAKTEAENWLQGIRPGQRSWLAGKLEMNLLLTPSIYI
jgi:hypothetical protein